MENLRPGTIISLAEFASRWKLTLTKGLGPKGLIEIDVIRGTKGYIYEHSACRLAYYAGNENRWDINKPRPVWFNPKGYPGELESISTQQILVDKLGIYPRAPLVPLRKIADYYREMDAYYKAEQQRYASAQPERSGGSAGT
jgi:hypothetical protein